MKFTMNYQTSTFSDMVFDFHTRTATTRQDDAFTLFYNGKAVEEFRRLAEAQFKGGDTMHAKSRSNGSMGKRGRKRDDGAADVSKDSVLEGIQPSLKKLVTEVGDLGQYGFLMETTRHMNAMVALAETQDEEEFRRCLVRLDHRQSMKLLSALECNNGDIKVMKIKEVYFRPELAVYTEMNTWTQNLSEAMWHCVNLWCTAAFATHGQLPAGCDGGRREPRPRVWVPAGCCSRSRSRGSRSRIRSSTGGSGLG
jgi:hypothetical protein